MPTVEFSEFAPARSRRTLNFVSGRGGTFAAAALGAVLRLLAAQPSSPRALPIPASTNVFVSS